MKKLITIIILLIAFAAIASDYQLIQLNIKYKGKIYKQHDCKIVKLVENRAIILTKNGKMIWVDVGNSSIQTAKNAIKRIKQRKADYKLQQENTITIDQLKGKYLFVAGLKMMRNFGKNGCLVEWQFWKKNRFNNRVDYYTTEPAKNYIYIVDQINVADRKKIDMLEDIKRDIIFQDTFIKISKKRYILYGLGLHTFDKMVCEKYTTKYSTYLAYLNKQK